MLTTKSLFHEQIEAEDKVLIDGVRLFPAHVSGFKKLRSVLGLSAAEAKAAIDKYETLECICAQACVGQLSLVALGRIVNERFNELLAE
jgi:hypothetical protein